MSEVTISKRRIVCIASIIVTVILFMQLYVITAWSANDANMGPTVVILQFSDDPDSDWAVNDIYSRLREFIPDDPFIVDRLTIRKSSDPNVIENLDADMVIYVSHGGPLGIVTGNCLTSWMQLADIIENSKVPIHLFTSCESKRIVKYGSSDSDKILYTVPGSRPAEVSDIEVISTVLLALGVDSSYVDTYRTQELTKAKEYIQNGGAIHIMSFSEVILDTISDIYDEDTSQTIYHDPADPFPPGTLDENYDTDQIVVRFNSTYTYDVSNYTSLSARIRDIIENYFRGYTLFGGSSGNRAIENLMITCVEHYYSNATYGTYGASGTLENLLDTYQLDPTLSTFYYDALELTELEWVYSETELIGISYSGTMQLSGMNTPYTSIELQIIANADGSSEIQNVFINQTCVGGLYVDTTYTGSVANSITGRNTGRSGSIFVDPLVSTDYEYIADWPGHPYTGGSNSVGQLVSIDDYLTVTSIPDAQGWHGPCFVQTLPSSFRLQDLTTFSANLSLFYTTYGATSTLVGLYDENQQPVLTLNIVDGITAYPTIHTIYYREDGSSIDHYSSIPSSDFQGVFTITYDCVSGLYGDLPGESRAQLCNPFEISWDRIVKYLVIESCRYYEDPPHSVRINDIRVDSVYSDYIIVHENCQTTDHFFNSTLLEWGTLSNGTIEVPSGESYIAVTDVAAGSNWLFRKSHILNGVSGAGCDYQIPITAHYGSGTDSGQDVYLNSHAKTDFSDVRFISSDGTSFLDYWCESVIVGTKAEFWVEISENLDYNQTIYIDYGNSAAESTSDGDATFIFFDDFSGATLDTEKWDVTSYSTGSGSNSYGLVNGELHVAASSTSSGTRGFSFSSAQTFMNTDVTLYAKARFANLDYIRGAGDIIAVYFSDNDGQSTGWSSLLYGDYYYYVRHYTDSTIDDMNQDSDINSGSEIYEYQMHGTSSLQTIAGSHSETKASTFGSFDTPYTIRMATAISYWTNAVSVDSYYDIVYLRKSLSSEPTHGEWGEEVNLGGWHGPNYVQVLNRPFRLNQLSDFSINGEILCDSNEEGRIQVGLFDEYKQCVMLFSWGNSGWCLYSTSYYYPEGAGDVSQTSEKYGSSYYWSARMWREDGLSSGVVFSEIDGQPISQPWNIANDSRVIKYLAIIPSRYGSTPMPELRIYDIQLIAAIDSSQYTVAFIENCRNTDDNLDLDNFNSLPEFNGYTYTDGSLYTSSSGYLYPSIPTGASGWHGPNFVHILAQSIPICNITNFMVTGEMVQSSSTMGTMGVALFDENMLPVMNIYWGDSWVGSIKGYHHVAYYDESGGGHYDTTDYIYSSFTRTGRIWYEDGTIKYEIEGIQSGTLGTVNNPDRMVKYVTIRPARSGSYSLVSMKLHGIVLTSDFRPADNYLRFIDECTDTDSFPKDLDFEWGVITDGDLETPTGTSYMTPVNMATGPWDWHGPNFVHELGTGLPLKMLANFSVTGEMVQSSSTLGKMDVALFDENKQIVMDISWGDGWYELIKGSFSISYYKEGGGGGSGSTDYIYSSFIKTGRVWYEDGNIKYEIEGVQSGDLGPVGNPDRTIKYIVIQPSRYSSLALVDLRIHDICLESSSPIFSEPISGFIEDCKNVYNLPKDLSFGWGVITDGSLTTPSDADYITPTSMTEYAPNWHGPNFVHILDQPLRLHELSDFAVIGEIVQSVNTLGKMDVALFDENKQIVMNIGWGDAWRDLIQASFWVTYYPEGGSASGASVGYFDTSFVRTGRMWYEDGNIKYEIEQPTGVQSGDLGAAANPYRLIKYVVVRPSQSGGFSMVDLRIRQISVASGFRVPTEQSVDVPVPVQTAPQGGADGSESGVCSNESDGLSPDVLLFAAQSLIYYWLECWWPTLKFEVNAPWHSVSVILQLTIDILGSINIVDSEFSITGVNLEDEGTANRIAPLAEQVELKAGHSGDLLTLATTAVMVTSWIAITWVTFAVFAIALGAWHLAMANHLWTICYYLANGNWTVLDAGIGIATLFINWACKLIGYFILSSKVMDRVMNVIEKIVGTAIPLVMSCVKWLLIISAILWILIIVKLIGDLLYNYVLQDIFESIMLQNSPL